MQIKIQIKIQKKGESNNSQKFEQTYKKYVKYNN